MMTNLFNLRFTTLLVLWTMVTSPAALASEVEKAMGMPLSQSYKVTSPLPFPAELRQRLIVRPDGCVLIKNRISGILVNARREEKFCAFRARLWPISSLEKPRKGKCREVYFSHRNSSAVSYRKGRSKVMELPERYFGQHSMLLQLGLDALDNEWQGNEYTVVDGHSLKHYRMLHSGREKLSVAAGTFETIRISGTAGEDERLELWVAPALGGLWVKQRRIQKDKKFTFELTEYNQQKLPESVLYHALADTVPRPMSNQVIGKVTPRCP